MRPLLFAFFLLGTLAYAFWRGDRDNRRVAVICCVATLLSQLAARPVGTRFDGVEGGLVAVDVLTFIGFTLVALSSSRFWPLWVAGLQLTASLAHLLKQIDLSLLPRVYAIASIFWSYPILVILAIGTWRAHQRRAAQTWDSQAPV